jgi:hypothetical protein
MHPPFEKSSQQRWCHPFLMRSIPEMELYYGENITSCHVPSFPAKYVQGLFSVRDYQKSLKHFAYNPIYYGVKV